MRKRRTSGGVTLNAVAGTHVVTLGLDLSEARRAGCLGFAIRREDHTEGERVWLRGLKTFAATDPELGPGQSVSTRAHPIQAFQWADYAAKPDHEYTYEARPVSGDPRELCWRTGSASACGPSQSSARPIPCSSTAARSRRRSTRGGS